MNRPISARNLGKLAGAVERVDNPGALSIEARKIVLAFLRQNRIVWTRRLQPLHEKLVGLPVALRLQYR